MYYEIQKYLVFQKVWLHWIYKFFFFCLITRKKKQLKHCICPKCVALCWKSHPLQTALKCSFYFILLCFPEPLCWLWYCVEFVSVLCCTNNLTHSRILMWFVVLMTGSALCWNARKSVEMTLLWNCLLLPFVDTRCHPWAFLRISLAVMLQSGLLRSDDKKWKSCYCWSHLSSPEIPDAHRLLFLSSV